SMGGLVSRVILCNPAEAINGGKGRRQTIALSSDDRMKADFIRRRTLYLTTLATPHQGSPEGDGAVAAVNLAPSSMPSHFKFLFGSKASQTFDRVLKEMRK